MVASRARGILITVVGWTQMCVLGDPSAKGAMPFWRYASRVRLYDVTYFSVTRWDATQSYGTCHFQAR